ncbi:MAG: ABC transporter transmembrane domain-containing protein [Alphaproteobacteria bacterium]
MSKLAWIKVPSMVERAESHSVIRFVVGSCRQALVWLFLFSFGINLLILASPIYMMQVFDRVLASGRFETLVFLTLIAGIAVFVMGVIETARGRFLIRVGNWLDHRLSGPVITSSLARRLSGHTGTAQPLRDLATLRLTIASPGINAVVDAPWVPAFIIIIWLMHPLLGLVALAGAIALFAVALLNELVSRRALGRAGRFSIAATQSVEQALRNAEVVQVLGMVPALLARFGDTNSTALDAQRQAGDRGAILIGMSKSLRLFVQIAILGSGAWLVLQGELTSGGMIAASILLSRALAPVEQSIGAWRQLVGARDAWQRLRHLIDSVSPGVKGMSLPAPAGDLSCQQMTYTIAGKTKPILREITFDLPAGEILGIIGPSAAGKSSLCKVLTGAWRPTGGMHGWTAPTSRHGMPTSWGRILAICPRMWSCSRARYRKILPGWRPIPIPPRSLPPPRQPVFMTQSCLYQRAMTPRSVKPVLSCPAASAKGWAWPGPFTAGPSSSSWTSQMPPWMRPARRHWSMPFSPPGNGGRRYFWSPINQAYFARWIN